MYACGQVCTFVCTCWRTKSVCIEAYLDCGVCMCKRMHNSVSHSLSLLSLSFGPRRGATGLTWQWLRGCRGKNFARNLRYLEMFLVGHRLSFGLSLKGSDSLAIAFPCSPYALIVWQIPKPHLKIFRPQKYTSVQGFRV